MNDTNPYSLPHLPEVFRALQNGYHFTIDDGDPYFALRDNRGSYEQLISALGYRLNEDARGYFYLTADEYARQSRKINQITVFTFILAEHVWQTASGGHDSIEASLLQSRWTIDELPHLSSERYLALLRQALGNRDSEVGHNEIRGMVRTMAEFGFVHFEDASRDGFRFRASIHRVLDLAYAALDTDTEAAEPTDTESEAEEFESDGQ